jgi:hypothetical protein
VAALVIRGISDLLTGKNTADDEYWQPAAARHAAAFAFELLDSLTAGRSGAGFEKSGVDEAETHPDPGEAGRTSSYTAVGSPTASSAAGDVSRSRRM